MKHGIKLLSLAMVLLLVAAGCSTSNTSTPPAAPPAPGSTAGDAAAPKTVDYPTKTVHIVNHSEVGGGLDLFARGLQPFLQQYMGQPVVIDNITGASGRIGTTAVWKADPDGYTLLMHQMPMTTIGDVLYDAEYNILEFEHLYSFDCAPYAIAVKKDSPYNSLKDLIEAGKTKRLTNSCSGIGGAMHFQSVLMKDELKLDYDDIPFNGSGPAMMAVLTGDVDFCITPYDVPLSNLEQYKVISVLANERIAAYPDVPTAKEEGYEFTLVEGRRCLSAPKGTDPAVKKIIVDAVEKAIKNEDFLKWADTSGVTLDPMGPEQYYELSKTTYELVEKYKPLFDAMNTTAK